MNQVFGLVSGLDTGALLDATLQGARVPVIRLQNRQSGIDTQVSKIGKISSGLNSLKSYIEDVADTWGETWSSTALWSDTTIIGE